MHRISQYAIFYLLVGLIAALTLAVQAAGATSIGTDISATGTLSVTGATTLSAALTLTSTTNPQVTVKYDAADYLTTAVSATGAVTFNSVGSALSNVFTFSDAVNIATSTTETLLTIQSSNTSNATTTLVVYHAGTGDLVNLFDGGSEVFTVLDGGKIGVGSSTPWGLFSIEASGVGSSFAIGSSTATILEVKSTGVVHGNDGATSYIDFIWEGDTNTDLLVVDASADKVGIGTTTPWGLLSVEASGVGSSFVVGSSTATILEVKSTGVVHGNDQATPYIDFIWEGDSLTNLFVIDASADRIGIGTTTPNAMLSVGNNAGSGSATSTLDFGKSCYHAYSDKGSEFWWWFAGSTGSALDIATSTEDCNNT